VGGTHGSFLRVIVDYVMLPSFIQDSSCMGDLVSSLIMTSRDVFISKVVKKFVELS